MRIGSLCSGIGGLDLAAETYFNATTVWHAEVDPGASAVIAHRWPGVPNLGDLTVVDWSTVEQVDIITAGWPCQPFSLAGSRKGASDVRHLWPHIADAIRILRPRYFVGENVPGHLTLGFDRVIVDLATLGFDAEWTTVRASDIGAPHRRERLFVLATNTSRSALGTEPVALTGSSDPLVTGLDHAPAADPDLEGLEGPQPARRRHVPAGSGSAATWGRYSPAIDRWERLCGRAAPDPLVDGRLNPELPEWMMGYPAGWVTSLPLKRLAMLKLCGNAVVPQQALLALGLLDVDTLAVAS